MPEMKFKCPEKGCSVMVSVWVPDRPQSQAEHNYDAACKKHKAKYRAAYDDHAEACKRLGIRS